MKRYLFNAAPFLPIFLSIALTSHPASSQQPVASFYYDEQGNVIRQARDTNGHGKMDRWTYYNRQGQSSGSSKMSILMGNPTFSFTTKAASLRAKRSPARTTVGSTPGSFLTPRARLRG